MTGFYLMATLTLNQSINTQCKVSLKTVDLNQTSNEVSKARKTAFMVSEKCYLLIQPLGDFFRETNYAQMCNQSFIYRRNICDSFLNLKLGVLS